MDTSFSRRRSLKAAILILPALLLSCDRVDRDGSLESLGETLVLALNTLDAQMFSESVCLSRDDYNDLLLTLEMVPTEEKETVFKSVPTLWERHRIEERRLLTWKESVAAAEAAEVEWEALHLKSIRLETVDGANRIDEFFVSLYHLRQKPAEVYVIVADDRNSYEIHLEDCVKTPNGWRSASGMRWRGNLEFTGMQRCVNNLRQLHSAKEQVAIEYGLQDGDIITEEQIAAYIRSPSGFSGLQCPQGGHYEINAIGEAPSCSVHGTVKKSYR